MLFNDHSKSLKSDMTSPKQFCIVRHVTTTKINEFLQLNVSFYPKPGTMCQLESNVLQPKPGGTKVPGKKIETFASSILGRSQTSIKQVDFQGKKKPDKHEAGNNLSPPAHQRLPIWVINWIPTYFKEWQGSHTEIYTYVQSNFELTRAPVNEKIRCFL